MLAKLYNYTLLSLSTRMSSSTCIIISCFLHDETLEAFAGQDTTFCRAPANQHWKRLNIAVDDYWSIWLCRDLRLDMINLDPLDAWSRLQLPLGGYWSFCYKKHGKLRKIVLVEKLLQRVDLVKVRCLVQEIRTITYNYNTGFAGRLLRVNNNFFSSCINLQLLFLRTLDSGWLIRYAGI